MNGRLYWAYLVEDVGGKMVPVKIHRQPLSPREEAVWRAGVPERVTILR